jgi:hypothetical protein
MDPKHWDKCVDMVNEFVNHPTPWLLKVRPLILDNKLAVYTEEQNDYIKDKMKKMPPKEWIDKMKSLKRLNTEEDTQGMQVVMENGEIIKSDTYQMLSNGWYFFTNWECNIGIDRFQIDPNGSIIGSCSARNLFHLKEPINLYDENFIDQFNQLDISPIKCMMLECPCPAEIKLPKRKHV